MIKESDILEIMNLYSSWIEQSEYKDVAKAIMDKIKIDRLKHSEEHYKEMDIVCPVVQSITDEDINQIKEHNF